MNKITAVAIIALTMPIWGTGYMANRIYHVLSGKPRLDDEQDRAFEEVRWSAWPITIYLRAKEKWESKKRSKQMPISH